MKKISSGMIVLIAVGLILLLSVFWFVGAYNSLIVLDESVNEKWANVQTAYQRRADLIPNLVSTVKQYADYEEGVFTAVTEARSKVGSANTPSKLDQAGQEMNSAISRLLMVAENYPNLKANENFLSLQDELAGTENRIKTERDLFNKAVKNFNIKVRRFPTNMIAGMFGFEKKDMFESEPEADTAPDVEDMFE